MNKEQLLRQILILFAVIIASVVLIRSLTSGETLLEYAEKNNIPVHSEETVNTEQENTEDLETEKPDQTE